MTTSHTQHAIELAIEGGFNIKIFSMDEFLLTPNCKNLFLDPLFWQSLGKALGYGKTCYHLGQGAFRHTTQACGDPNSMERWQYEWHSFIDALASGQTPDDFFATILPADK